MPKVRCMPATKYNRTISTIRDYPRMVYEYEGLKRDVGVGAVGHDGMPNGSMVDSEVEEKAVRMADLKRLIDDDDIQSVIDTIPPDMQDGILDNIYYGTRFPLNEYGQLVSSLSTWKCEKKGIILLFSIPKYLVYVEGASSFSP